MRLLVVAEPLGRRLACRTELGRDVTVEGLLAQGYDAVYVALGAYESHRLGVPGEDKAGMIRRLADAFHDGAVDYLDGVTVEYPDWWFNVRPSNTEPLLRLNVEATSAALLEDKTQMMLGLIRGGDT